MNVDDHADELATFISQLDNEQIVDELAALQSIYGDDAIRPYTSEGAQQSANTRYVVQTTLSPPHDEVRVRILVSLPPDYPASSPPQLQLLSRYIGSFGVSTDLFSSVLRTFISLTGVEWNTGDVCVFDGVEHVRERCSRWYTERLDHEMAAQLQREGTHTRTTTPIASKSNDTRSVTQEPVPLPAHINLFEAEPITDRKSAFVGRACRIAHPNEVPAVLDHLMSDRKVARAAHPIIHAWRCSVNGVMQSDNDDDGESAAGGRLAHLLQLMDLDHVLVIVTRYFGGIHLGPDRFKHINQAARNALELGGFLEDASSKKQTARNKH
ncbi:UPF0029-domain-containing protein [Exidia glandulosa HHB12029]|uniref:UPF0029-domain-containing protein n=1 Tax=Exidia glandulosa HHB12029 TaxID=1314781 RepID=A0A165QWX2_EXIGL|nr:UPF0029-domain-containing protein [Exidia glandulosa HHB12029]